MLSHTDDNDISFSEAEIFIETFILSNQKLIIMPNIDGRAYKRLPY